MHPSEFSDDEPGSYLPDGVTEDQVTALVEDVLEKIKKVGLYCKGAHVAVGDDDLGDEPVLMIHGMFTFGKVAFTPRIQDPEQDAVDDQFNVIERYENEATAESIVESFKRGKNEPEV